MEKLREGFQKQSLNNCIPKAVMNSSIRNFRYPFSDTIQPSSFFYKISIIPLSILALLTLSSFFHQSIIKYIIPLSILVLLNYS